MASILRSSKFVRYIAGFARNIVVNTPREFDGSFVNGTQCLCGAAQSSFATQATVQHDQNLDRSLRRIDHDVRRSGRISRRDIDDILEEIKSSRSATSSQSLLVIRCCGNLVPEELPDVRTKLVQEIWNTLEKLNVPMDISHYNALLRVYLENEHKFSPTEFLSDLESKGIEPNRVTYQRLIARYCQDGDIEGATRILEFMREKQLPVNENVFNALISGHAQLGDMDSAQGIISVMSQAGLEPSADTYTTLLCGYAKKGDINSINSLLNECESKEIHLLDKDLLDVIYALSINGHKQYVPEILSKVRKAFGYIQDAVILILRLVNKGEEDTAYLILKSMPRGTKPDGSMFPVGLFFIKQLVKAERPLEKILEYSKLLEEEKLYDRGLMLATEVSLRYEKENLAYPLLDKLRDEGIPIRQHYFWPLIVSKGKQDPTGNDVVKVLLEMNKFGLSPSSETVRDYVIPNIQGKSSDIIAKLRDANISVGSVASSLVYSLLLKNDIKEASVIASTVTAYYSPDLLKRPLTNAFYTSNNIDCYIQVLRGIYENLHRVDYIVNDKERNSFQVKDKVDVISDYLLDLSTSQTNFISVAEAVLTEFVNQGFSITTTAAEKVQEKLGEKISSSTFDALAKLSSGELTYNKKIPAYTPSSKMDIPQLEQLIHNLSLKKQDTKGLKRQLLTLYCHAKEVNKLELLLKELEKHEDFKYTGGVYAQLLDLYAYHDNLEKAIMYYNKLKELDPSFPLDHSKIMRYATALIKNDRFDDAIAFLDSTDLSKKRETNNFSYNTQCWKLFNHLAELGKDEQLETLFNVLVKNDLIEVNNVMLGPFIKVHLVNNDIDKALAKFELCCNKYKATPWKNELACKLIQKEDAEKLQKLTDLSTSVHGEINSLYDLVFAFVECGRIRQARKILETPGLQQRQQRLNTICQRYQNEGLVQPLEGLKDATKHLNYIDRSDIYYQLLLSYIKQENVDKSLGLWTQMQEEDMAPTDEFLSTLGNFLKEKNVDVPFVIPQQHIAKKEVKNDVQTFRQCIKEGKLNKALEIKRKTKDILTVTDLSILIEKLVQSDRANDATKIATEMLQKNSPPITRILRYLLNKLANNGDVETIEAMGKVISQDLKKIVSFDNRICHANLVAGKAEEYLNKLESEIDNAKDDELLILEEKFPRGGAVGILQQHPQLSEKFESIATKYSERGIVGPFNVLWSHLFINGEEEKAESIWKDHLQGAPRIMFQRIVQHARENLDENLTRKLIDHLKISKVTDGAIGNAYSCVLDILVAKDKTDEVVSTFEQAIKDIPIDFINRTAVLRVRDVYDKLNKPFNYPIPPKVNNKNSSSSNSSSDDKRQN